MVLFAVLALVVFVAALYAWGLALPEEHVVNVSKTIAAPPERVFARITAFEEHPHWRAGVASVVYDRGAKRVVEKNSMGELPYLIVKSNAPHQLVTEIDGGRKLGFGGTWVFDIAVEGAASKVSITEHGRIYSPFFRVMSKLFFPHDKTAKAYLEDLSKSLSPAPPVGGAGAGGTAG